MSNIGPLCSGIFVSPTAIVRQTQSVGASLVVWLFGGIYSFFVGWTYAELGAMFKESGGDYVYTRTALGPATSFIVVWTHVVLRDCASRAALCMVSSEYLLAVLLGDNCGPPWILERTLPIFLIVASIVVNIYSSKWANRVQAICTLGKMFAMVVIVGGGIYRLATGHTDNFKNAFDGTETNPGQLAIAVYSGLFAYGGAENVAKVTEEIENPSKVVPRAVFLGLGIVICTYLLVNLSYFTVMNVDEMIASSTVAGTWAETVIPSFSWFISLAVVISAFGTTVGLNFVGPKLVFSAARHGELPLILSMIHVKWLTPFPVLVYSMIVSSILIFPAEIWTLVSALGFVALVWHCLASVSLLVLRRRHPEIPRPVKVPLFIPILVIILASFLLVISIVMSKDRLLYVYALAFLAASLPVYFIFVFKEISIPGTSWLTARLQMAMNVVPSEDEFVKPNRQIIVEELDLVSDGFTQIHGEPCYNRNVKNKGGNKIRHTTEDLTTF